MAKATGKDTSAPKGAKPKGTEKKAAPEVTETAVVVSVKSGALSVDVGPQVIAGLSKAYDDEAKANAIIDQVRTKRFDLLSMTTQAIVKAAKADDTINLAVAFKDDKKGMALLNDQLGLALGFREITTIGEGDKAKRKIGYAKAVLKYFPGPKDDKKSQGYTQKSTTRTNFLHMLKKCAQASHAIVVNDLTMKKDAASGTLLLEGKGLQGTFGADRVLLDEKLTVKNTEGEVKLKEKPSFTSIARMGAAAEGKVLQQRKQSGTASTAVDVDTALQSICNTLTSALGKLAAGTKLLPKTVELLKAVQAAVASKIV